MPVFDRKLTVSSGGKEQGLTLPSLTVDATSEVYGPRQCILVPLRCFDGGLHPDVQLHDACIHLEPVAELIFRCEDLDGD